MGVSLEKAIEIICSTQNSLVVTEEEFQNHLESFGVYLTAEAYMKVGGGDYIIYRDLRNFDVIGFSKNLDTKEYRTVDIKSLQ